MDEAQRVLIIGYFCNNGYRMATVLWIGLASMDS